MGRYDYCYRNKYRLYYDSSTVFTMNESGDSMSTISIENYLQKVQSVMGCKVVMDKYDAISEIHIVSDLRRSPKQILRDIEAIMISEFDTSIDYKKVSIAQIQSGSIKLDQDPRLKLKLIEYNNNGTNVCVKVALEKQGMQYQSEVTGINTVHNFKRLVGSVVLKAVEQYLEAEEVFVFEDVKRVELANVDVMLVSITSVHGGREEIFTGTAKIISDSKEAIARATLDAVNRHVLHLDSI